MNGTYDLPLVIASYCVAAFASYAALDLGARIACFSGARQRYWLIAGAMAVGSGIWSMHLVGMNAVRLPLALTYDLPLTTLSWVVAVGVAMLGMYVVSRSQLTMAALIAGAVAMSAGFGLMHGTGLWATGATPHISFDPVLLGLAAGATVLSSALTLFFCFALRNLPGRRVPVRIATALLLAAAFCGSHYSGMAAVHFAEGTVCAAGNLLSGSWMGLPLAAITIGLLVATLLLARMDARAVTDQRRIEHRRNEAERVRRLAYYDSVTGLPNRSVFNETLLRQLIKVNGKAPRPFSVIYSEVRGYRALVEKHGQDRVNLIMKALAGKLSAVLGEGDLLARLSHDGFVFLLRERAERGADAALAQLGALLNAPLQYESQTFKLAWGLGSSRYPDNGNSTQALIRAAMKLQREVGSDARPALKATVSVLGAA